MARPEVRRVARALDRRSQRSVARHGRRGHVAVVAGVSPLVVDVDDLDARLTDDDVTIGDALAARFNDQALAVGDALVLVEVGHGDYSAVDVHRKADDGD